jgi:hypothetical protein
MGVSGMFLITDKIIAGFHDAEGSTSMPRRLAFELGQSHDFGYHTLCKIQHHLGTTAGISYRRDVDAYRLNFYTDNAWIYFTRVIRPHCVIKGGAFQKDLICDEWIGGFFAGDGCVWFSRLWAVKIVQKDKRVIEAIKDYIGYGHIYEKKDSNAWEWRASARNEVVMFYNRFGKFCLHKEALLMEAAIYIQQ